MLSNYPCDIYIFDIGGLCATDYSGRARGGFCRTVLEQLQERPSTAFIPWSRMTKGSVRGAIEDLVLGNADEVPDDYKEPSYRNLYLPPKDAPDLYGTEELDDVSEWLHKFISEES